MKGMNYVYLGIVAAILITGISAFFLTQKPRLFCGDGVCAADENCGTCFADCRCPSGQYCSPAYVCTKPVCGSDVCELFENPGNCCGDCGCYGNDEICSANRCETFVSRLTDQQVEDAIRKYSRFKGRENEIISISDFAVVTFDNKPAKSATIELKDQHSQGGILLENGTLVIMEKTIIVDTWAP